MAQSVELYNVTFPESVHPVRREFDMIRMGGRWQKKNGDWAGLGLAFHFRRAIELLWPEIQWHKWIVLNLEQYVIKKYIGVMGPAASGKTNNFAILVLLDYYVFPNSTTALVCSTTKERLEDRIWGEIKKFHRIAKANLPWIPGGLIEGRQRIVTDQRMIGYEGRNFKNGIIGVPVKRGNQYVGLSDFVGMHNKRVRLVGDELQLIPKSFIDSISNIAKNEDAKIVGLGNPKETTDALGVLCAPSDELGGWDAGLDQEPGTKTWPTRFPDGVCIQLPGSDSPNMVAKIGEKPPFPFLITRQNMEDDAKVWGVDDWHYTMMDEGKMPRGQGSRRVLTRTLCQKQGAFNEAEWRGGDRTWIGALDAAYRSVGGDRCVLMFLCFGEEADAGPPEAILPNLLVQDLTRKKNKIILALMETFVIPIKGESVTADKLEAEEQIVAFVKAEFERRRLPPDRLFYDSGMRTSLVQAFGRLWSSNTNSIDCGGKATQRKVSSEIDVKCVDQYSKLITEFWWSVRLCVESGQFRGMTEDTCLEFCQREWKLVSGNKIEVESKVDMKEKTGRSPDLADCTAIGVEGARRLGFVISKLGASRQPGKRGDPWKDLRKKAEEARRSFTLQEAT